MRRVRRLSTLFRADLCLCIVSVVLLGMAGCGKDGSIIVGVVSTPPIPPEPTITPVPPPSPTPSLTPIPSATPTPEPSNCCSVHPDSGCDDPACQQCVCEVDPDDFCCADDGSWDPTCVDLVLDQCGSICPCP
jgi:hypothetical protein